MGSYRTRLEIVADVLSAVRGGAKKTQIMYRANLSYTLLVRYLDRVLEAGLVAPKGGHYVLTRKGEEFLDRFGDYSERLMKLDRWLDEVRKEKTVLESSFLNAETMPAKSPGKKKPG